MSKIDPKYHKEFLRLMQEGRFEQTAEGIVFREKGALARGRYHITDRHGSEVVPNLLPDQGLTDLLAVYLGATNKRAAFYLALYSGAVSPQPGWTAANFSASASEITSNTEGYSDTTRRQFVAGTAANTKIDNLASKADFHIVCTTSVTLNGAAMISDNVKGGTSGILLSAVRFPAPRLQYNGDTFQLGYEVDFNSP